MNALDHLIRREKKLFTSARPINRAIVANAQR
jgi:hypothetical protein